MQALVARSLAVALSLALVLASAKTWAQAQPTAGPAAVGQNPSPAPAATPTPATTAAPQLPTTPSASPVAPTTPPTNAATPAAPSTAPSAPATTPPAASNAPTSSINGTPAAHHQLALEPYSVFDAEGLGDHRLALAFGAGFPYVQILAAYSLVDWLDADLNIDSLFGVATQFSLGPKIRLLRTDSVSVAFEMQGQAAVFRTPAASEQQGARYLTGMRNWGIQPQLIVSTRGSYGSIFGSFVYEGTFDTEPVSATPLGGNPGAWSYGSNIGFHLGGELAPAKNLVHGYALIGLDFHLRDGDFPVLPLVELGFDFPT